MMRPGAHALVTGGAGYLGERLVRQLVDRGYVVGILDIVPPVDPPPGVEVIVGNILDRGAVERAVRGRSIVFHNVAQVPLAKDIALLWSINRDGTKILVDECLRQATAKLVYTSSSAIFGVPQANPVTEATDPVPAEDYGRAKLAGEMICRQAAAGGLDVAIVRPRTILGHGRLGVVQILFDWVERGLDIPVLGQGRNVYQFVHADDLAVACIAAAERRGPGTYNIGTDRFGTMREALEALIRHAGTGSRIRSIPLRLAELAANAASAAGLSPLGPYHSLMYGRSLWFDISLARRELGFQPRYSNDEMLCESYDWYRAHKTEVAAGGQSPHRSPVRQKLLGLVPHLLRLVPQ